MSMPFYVAPEQVMKDRADYARKGIARGRSAVALTYDDGVLLCAENPAAIGQAFNVGNPQGTATNFELANMIIRLTASRSEIVFKPHPGPEVDLRVPSIDKAMSLVGYKPAVSLEAGISRTIPFYKDNLAAVAGTR